MTEFLLRPTWAEINKDAIRKNLKKISEKVSPSKVLFIVKANAYGHGASVLAKMAEEEKLVSGLGVSSVEEGIALRKSHIKLPILVLGSLYPFKTFVAAIKANLTITIASIDAAKQLIKAVNVLKKTVKCHIKLETGMSRIGARRPAAVKIYNLLSSSEYIKIQGLYSHFSSADSLDEKSKKYTLRQLSILLETKKEIELLGGNIEICHTTATAGILNYPQSYLDMVRPGIAAYGYSKGFSPSLTWKSKVVFIKTVSKGTCISYCRTFTADRDMRIATIPVGYADGYSRAFSNKADVLICGKRCRVVGNVTMDMIMVDITDVADCHIGSQVVLIGKQKKEEVTAEELANMAGTISYEILTGISERVPRIYLK